MSGESRPAARDGEERAHPPCADAPACGPWVERSPGAAPAPGAVARQGEVLSASPVNAGLSTALRARRSTWGANNHAYHFSPDEQWPKPLAGC